MAKLKPWFHVVQPREDLREGKPLDASEFAVHLDQVRDSRAPDVYRKPELFFDRTYLTQNLTDLAAQVIRRLSGEKTETSAVFNMATQFGGGKTHALTLLYHLATHGPAADRWTGVARLLAKASIATVPQAATAVFVGTEFDSLTGRGGDDGTPLRKTPWGEIAFQLGGKDGFVVLAEHEKQMTAPAGDVIRKFLPNNKPCLILMDELMNYVSRNRRSGLASQFYTFLQNLSEEARGRNNVVLACSIPASELEMSAEDHADYERFKKLLDRVGKAVVMAAEEETSEIIRRRLFEWDERAVSQEGKVLLNRDAHQTCSEYAEWVLAHRQQIPEWFPVDYARDAFAATYPFHPLVLSVFERKWQALPRFQRTRGVLRLLALWVARAYQEGFKGAHRDPLIGLGTAPLDDPLFRAAMFEQLGEPRLEGAVTTDICGRKDAHAIRLDAEVVDAIKKARLHRKVATTIFFESNGGQLHTEATVPEVRLAVGEPDLDIGNVETVLETLGSSCYFLSIERNRYRFSLSPNLNKLLSDRRASIPPAKIEEHVGAEVQKVFEGKGIERVFFPERSNQISDRAALTFVVLTPDQSLEDEKNLVQWVETMTRECGTSARTFKSALIWCVADTASALRDEARKLLAWEAIQDEEDTLRLDDSQKRQLAENIKKAQRDLKEAIWRAYKNVLLLGKDNTMRVVDLGLVHSSAADTLIKLILNRLREDGDVEEGASPNFLIRNWSPAFIEWSTKAVRDAFFASPQFPRLLNGETVKETIARGVRESRLAYIGKAADGGYDPFCYGTNLNAEDVELSDEMFVITKEVAERYKKAKEQPPVLTSLVLIPDRVQIQPGQKHTFTARGLDQDGHSFPTGNVVWKATGGIVDVDGVFLAGQEVGSFTVTASTGALSAVATVTIAKEATQSPLPLSPSSAKEKKLRWTGDIPPQKWMNFYTKVLSRFAASKGLKITLTVEVSPDGGTSEQKIEETKVSLRELGLKDDVSLE